MLESFAQMVNKRKPLLPKPNLHQLHNSVNTKYGSRQE